MFMRVCLINQAVSLIVSECISTCAKPCKTTPRSCCKNVMSAANSGRSNCCIISKTPCTNPKSAKKMSRSHGEHTARRQIRLPAVPWGPLQSHTLAKQFSSARMCSCTDAKPMVDEAESTKTTGSINSSD